MKPNARSASILTAALLFAAGCTTTETTPPPTLPQAGPESLRTFEEQSDTRLVVTFIDVTPRWTEATDPTVKAGLEDYLRKLSQANAGSLLRLLGSGDPRQRTVAAGALGFTGNTRYVQPLIGALDSTVPEVVANALFSLWLLKSPDTPRGPVVKALSSPNPRVRSNAALVLGAIVQPGETGDFLQPLIFLLQDSDDVARAEAAGALGKIGDREATPHLVKALSDRYTLIRLRAAVSLGAIRDPAAVPALIQALGDDNDRVRVAAHKALQATTGKDLPLDRSAWELWLDANGIPGAR
jgi:HEAT repeat protein